MTPAECQKRYGCTPEQFDEVRRYSDRLWADGRKYGTLPLQAFYAQKGAAKQRGVEFKLTFWEWWTIWQKSGKWLSRGRSSTGYVMCRIRDKGGYEVGNVYIARLSHNSAVQPNNPRRRNSDARAAA